MERSPSTRRGDAAAAISCHSSSARRATPLSAHRLANGRQRDIAVAINLHLVIRDEARGSRLEYGIRRRRHGAAMPTCERRANAWNRLRTALLRYCRAARSVTADTIRRLYRLVRHVQPPEPASLPTCLPTCLYLRSCLFPSTPSRDTVRPPEAFTWRTPSSRERFRNWPTILRSNFTASFREITSNYCAFSIVNSLV